MMSSNFPERLPTPAVRQISLMRVVAVCCCAFLGLFCMPLAARAQSVDTAVPPGTLSDLVAAGNVHDALSALSEQHEPYDLPTLLARAELLLMAGYSREAEAEFERTRGLTPADEPLADYGIAMCRMMRGDLPDARATLQRCTESAAYADHKEEIDLAVTSLSAADYSSAAELHSQSSSLLIQELSAIQSSKAADFQNTLANASPWMLPSDVPRVSEPFGLRPDALIAHECRLTGQKWPTIAAPLIGSDAASQIVSALLPRQFPAAGAPSAKTVQGIVVLFPPPGTQAVAGDLASYVIDGNVAGVVNSDSLAYRWDTRQYQNGRHSVQVFLSSSANLPNQPIYIRYFEVRNPEHSASVGVDSPLAQSQAERPKELSAADQAAVESAWRILELQPDYALGERALARNAQLSGDSDAALYHLSCAQAIDFNGDLSFLHQLAAKYARRVPVNFANTDRTRSHPEAETAGLWRGNPYQREVALTFDDGPSPTLTPPLLDALRDAHVPGTFFVVGARAQLAPDLVRRMHAEGHEVEDHSYSHPNLDDATPQHVYEEILRNAVVVEALTGTWPHFLRPPGGQSNPHVLISAAKCGMTGAFWTLDVLSAEDSGSPEAVTQFVLKRVKPGAVILMHNGPYATTHAIAGMAAQLRARGYTLVTLLQLARDVASK